VVEKGDRQGVRAGPIHEDTTPPQQKPTHTQPLHMAKSMMSCGPAEPSHKSLGGLRTC
jgi:hypothetical protein